MCQRRIRLAVAALLLICVPPASAAPDDNWSGDFASPFSNHWGNYPGLNAQIPNPATDATIYDGVTFGGELVVGGNLSSDENDIPMRGVARWDGSAWQPLAEGINGEVRALSVWNSALFAAGDFDSAGLVLSTDIARWNGSAWSIIPGTSSGIIHDLFEYDGALVACGSFSEIGGVPAAGIAAWNGTSWSALGAGLGAGAAHVLWQFDGDLIAGGEFLIASGAPGDYLATWNGTTWSSLTGGPDGPVFALHTWNGDLVVGGDFTGLVGAPGTALRVAAFDGSSWSAFGAGLYDYYSGNPTEPGAVLGFASNAEYLIACGDFNSSVYNGSTGGGVARWTGTLWERMGAQGIRNHLVWHDGSLHSLGTRLGVQITAPVAQWTQASLRPLGFHFNSNPVIDHNGSVFVGIDGTDSSLPPNNDVVRFNGSGWDELGFDAEPLALYSWNGLIVASADIPTQVRAWDGTTWSPMDAGLPTNHVPQVFQEFNGTLYCGLTANVSTSQHLWRWTGALWEAVPGVSVPGEIYAMASYGGELYFSGAFGLIGSEVTRRIAAYDGTIVRKLGVGLSGGDVLDFQEFNGNLIMGGSFLSAGPLVVTGLAGYDGANWFDIGEVENSSPNVWVRSLTLYNGRLIAGGLFHTVGGVPATNIGAYNGTTWESLGSGVGNTLYGIAGSDGSLWVTGFILSAGGKSSSQIARWTEAITHAGDISPTERTTLSPAFPNPFRASTSVEFVLEQTDFVRAEVHDVRGRLVRTLVDQSMNAGTVRLTWNGLNQSGAPTASGIYFLSVSQRNRTETQRVVRLP